METSNDLDHVEFWNLLQVQHHQTQLLKSQSETLSQSPNGQTGSAIAQMDGQVIAGLTQGDHLNT